MRNELTLSVSTLMGFLLTLARVSGVFVFVPLPGIKDVMNPVRVMLSMGITMALFGQWPHPDATASAGLFMLWLVSEAGLGIGVGLAVAFATEAFSVGAQMMGLQAGYSFASTIDPQTQADSPVLVIFAQLAAGLLFFALGLDGQVLQVFARSLAIQPPGSFVLSRGAVEAVVLSGSMMLSTGVRLALPVTAVMIMADISLALVGRVNAQLHLITIALPVKMIVAISILSWLVLVMPNLLRGTFAGTFEATRALIGH
jgi:flagellar biosynthetic protein FliR